MFSIDEETRLKLAAIIREKRLARGFTLNQFAKFMKIDRSGISRIETAKRGMSLPLLKRVLEYLGIEFYFVIKEIDERRVITCPKCLHRQKIQR